MQTAFSAAVNQLCDEKNIDKNEVIDMIKAAIRAAYRKDYGNKEQNIDVDLDNESGNTIVYVVKKVVKKVEDPELEMTVAEAKKYKKDPKIDDEVKFDVTPVGYGRIAAQSAKQVILQRVQEAERELMYKLFKDRENELINAVVHRVDGTNVYISLDGKLTTGLPYDQQIPGEKYTNGQRIKLYLDKVIKTSKGPQLLISRTHPNLVRKLMELEVPEIKSGLVEIKGISRDPGIRCKISVSSNDPKIDPIGSCVGQKGVRVKSVMYDLHGERLDIILWSADLESYIKAALSPAKISQINIDDANRRATVYVATDQRPLAIGKQGQNVKLASELVGIEIDIKDIAEITPKVEVEEKKVLPNIAEIGLDPAIVAKLAAANLSLTEQIKGLGEKDLMGVPEISETDAKQIIEALKNVK
ncbi:MAG: transcription termination factor NusA [Candidatus Gracilibacteria bacterium]